MRNQNKKRPEILKFFFIALAVSTSVFGINIVKYKSFLIPHETLWLSLTGTLLIIALLTAGLLLLGGLFQIDGGSGCRAIQDRRVSPALCFGAVILIYSLYLAAYYPGTNSWDTFFQVRDFFDGTSRTRYAEGGGMVITAFLNDHHPIVTTLIFSAFVKIGRAIGNESAGLFLFSLLQVALYACACAEAVKYCQAKNDLWGWLVAGFYVFNPFLPYYAIMMLKDSLFAPLLLIYFLRFIELYRREKGDGPRSVVWFIALSIIIPLTKKTGVYIVVLSNIVLLLHGIKRGKRFKITAAASILAPVLIMFVLFPHILFPALNIFPGGKQEMLATLLQQSARVGIDHQDAYSEEDKAILNSIFGYDAAAQNYAYEITDPIKNTYKLRSVKREDLAAYYRLWLRTGLRYPITYLKATAGTCGGFFAPTAQLNVYRDNHLQDITTAPALTALRQWLEALYAFLMETPGLNIIMYIVVYTWWIPLFATCALIRKRGWRSLGLMMPLYVSVLILVVCPQALSRYALPLVMMAPVMLCGAARPDL